MNTPSKRSCILRDVMYSAMIFKLSIHHLERRESANSFFFDAYGKYVNI